MKGTSISRIKLTSFVLISLLAHVAGARLLSGYGLYDFARPISAGEAITLDLNALKAVPVSAAAETPDLRANERNFPEPSPACIPSEPSRLENYPRIDANPAAVQKTAEGIETGEPNHPVAETPKELEQAAVKTENNPVRPHILPPHRMVSEFLSVNKEKLSYQITLYGVPVGSALLEAANKDGELRIVSRARSNDAFSLVYPVDNVTETRIINGNYIMTTIRQNEGMHRSDTGFTLMLPEKKVFWVDRIKKRYKEYPVQDADVLDIITGIYFIRKQPLEVGKSVILKLFDSNEYAPTPIEVLRKETVALAGGRQVATLVIHPVLKTDGFFRRTGEVVVWLTDDENRVPVRLETTIPLGKISVELVSAEIERNGDDTTK